MTQEKFQKAQDLQDQIMSARTEIQYVKEGDKLNYLKHYISCSDVAEDLNKKIKNLIIRELNMKIKKWEIEFGNL